MLALYRYLWPEKICTLYYLLIPIRFRLTLAGDPPIAGDSTTTTSSSSTIPPSDPPHVGASEKNQKMGTEIIQSHPKSGGSIWRSEEHGLKEKRKAHRRSGLLLKAPINVEDGAVFLQHEHD